MQRDSGFTLIELVVVIIILGLLAAFAVPRFLGVQREARISTLQGLQGSINGAASLTYAKAMSTGNSTISSEDVIGSFKGIETVGSTTGEGVFPEANEDGIVEALQDTSGYQTENGTTAHINGLGFSSDFEAFDNDNTIVFWPDNIDLSDTPDTQCAVGYAANSTDYAVEITTDDC